jgi:Tol biopolymer transport system component
MTDDQFGRTLATWLHDEAEHRVPDHLGEVLVQTVATRQRPWWSSLERLLPMTTTVRTRASAHRPLLVLAIMALLVLVLAGIALLAGALRTTNVPLGPASNGRIVVADGTTLYTYAGDGTDRRELISNGVEGSGYSISTDGARVAFKVGGPTYGVRVVTLADGTSKDYTIPDAELLADEPVGWSPDGKQIAIAGVSVGRERLFVLDLSKGTATAPLGDVLKADVGVWLPSFSPDGQWIAFAAVSSLTSYGRLYIVHPDGTGLRALDVPSVVAGDGGGPVWSPARDQHRIAYLTFSGGALQTRIVDIDGDSDSDHLVGPGFWPSWSPDGSRLATCCAEIHDVEASLRGAAAPTTIFEQFDANCGDVPSATGRSICSAVVWSPDGQWVIAADVVGKDLLLAPADGSQPPRRIPLAAGLNVGGFRPPIAWQPVWP